ncbi:MAG: hypothetical protein ACLQVI_19155 [Polyangiaceae bacterium]
MRKAFFSAVGLAMCAACTSSVITTPPANGGTHQDGAGASEGIPPSSTTTYAVEVGGTVPIAPGTQAGYALTASALKTYQLRWTGDASVNADGYKEFYGSAWTTGHFTSITPGCVNSACPLETGDYVSGVETVTGGERIDWDTFASDGWDGFGFTTDTEPVYFDVYIDGNRLPQLFYFPVGTNEVTTSPASSPFGVTSTN